MSVRAPVNILTTLFKRTPGHVSLSCLFSPSWANMVRPIDQAMFGSLDQWWLIFCVLSWGVQLALIPLLFSSIRGNLVANLFDLTIEVLILLTPPLSSFICEEEENYAMNMWYLIPPPLSFPTQKRGLFCMMPSRHHVLAMRDALRLSTHSQIMMSCLTQLWIKSFLIPFPP